MLNVSVESSYFCTLVGIAIDSMDSQVGKQCDASVSAVSCEICGAAQI